MKAVLQAAEGGHTEEGGFTGRGGGHTEEGSFTVRRGSHGGRRFYRPRDTAEIGITAAAWDTRQFDPQHRPAWAAFIRRCAPIYARRLGSPRSLGPSGELSFD